MKKKLIIAFVVFTAVGAGIFYLLTTGNVGAQYNTAEVEKGEIAVYVEERGRISSGDVKRYYAGGAMRVEQMDLELGERVEAGQLLIKYEDHLDLERRKVEKQIEALEATYGEALAGTDVERVNSAKIEIARIGNDLALAKKNRDRTEALFNSGAASRVELEQANNSVDRLQSSLATARNTYGQLVKGVSENVKKRYEAEIDVLLLTLETLEKNREDTQVHAQSEGIVTELNTFVGDTPAPGTLVLELVNPTEKVLLIDFMAEDARKIQTGMTAMVVDPVVGISLDDLRVERIHPKAFITLSELGVEENRQTVEIGLPASLDDHAYGIEVEARVIIDEAREVLLVPKGAVFRENGLSFVEVLEEGDPVEREITTGTEVDDHVEVITGLEEGQQVILNYQED
jgi:HlyD family secretion protein